MSENLRGAPNEADDPDAGEFSTDPRFRIDEDFRAGDAEIDGNSEIPDAVSEPQVAVAGLHAAVSVNRPPLRAAHKPALPNGGQLRQYNEHVVAVGSVHAGPKIYTAPPNR